MLFGEFSHKFIEPVGVAACDGVIQGSNFRTLPKSLEIDIELKHPFSFEKQIPTLPFIPVKEFI